MSHYRGVTVGVNGSAAARAAVAYGAAEAARLKVPLRLVCVVPPPGHMPGRYGGVVAASAALQRHEAFQVLDAARETACSLLPEHEVDTAVVRGERRRMLCAASAAGQLVVLGRPRPGVFDGVRADAMVSGVGGRAVGPVVMVPEGWSPGAAERDVVVGVAVPEASAGLLWRAFAIAAERRAELAVAHAAELRVPYGRAEVEDAQLVQWNAAVACSMKDDIAACVQDFAEVAYRLECVNGPATEVLAGITRDAELLVIARTRTPLGHAHLGVTGRALVAAVSCPIQVVPPAGEAVWERDAALEVDGTLIASSM